MNWQLLATTFAIVFLAELGDKTQLAALALTGRTGSPGTVFLGALLAMAVATGLGVVAGAALHRLLSPKVLEIGCAVLFLAVGAFLLVRAIAAGSPQTSA